MATLYKPILGKIAAALAIALCAGAAFAQTYPAKPIKLISPYPPGGGTDAAARIIAQALGDQMGQQVVVDTRGGASGLIGTELAAKSAPDGYTIVLGNVAPLAILPAAVAKMPYDPIRDFSPISLIATSDYVLTVHPSLPVKTPKQLIALAKANPGKLTYASSGSLGAPHLAGELLNLLGGVRAGCADPLVYTPADQAVSCSQEAQGPGRSGQRGQQVGGCVHPLRDRRHRQSGRRHGSHERQE